MSLIKKTVVAAAFVAVFSVCSAPEAKANPLEKLFANAGKKAVGGISKSIGRNVTQSSRLILKAAPYALLQGNRTNSSGSGLQGATLGTTGQMIQSSVIRNGVNQPNNVYPRTTPTRTNRTYRRPVYFRSQFRR